MDVGGGDYFAPGDYYDYEAFDVNLVPTVVGNEQTGAGATLMVEVGKGVTGYANGDVIGIEAQSYETFKPYSPYKTLHNGRLLILKDDVRYNAQGQRIDN